MNNTSTQPHTQPQRWDFYHRRESNTLLVTELPCVPYTFDLPTGDVAVALGLAYDLGLPRGSARAGCVEIQSDEGIWSRSDGKRIDLSTPHRAGKVNFTSWE